MDGKIIFRRMHNGQLHFSYTEAAKQVANANKSAKPGNSLPPAIVRQNALDHVNKNGGDTKNDLLVLGQHVLMFGAYRGQTFNCMLENGLGYAAWLVDGLRGERPVETPLSQNKFQFKRYVESFPEGREAVEEKKKDHLSKTLSGLMPQEHGKTASSLSSLLVGRPLSDHTIKYKLQKLASEKFKSLVKTVDSSIIDDADDDELVAAMDRFEAEASQTGIKDSSIVYIV